MNFNWRRIGCISCSLVAIIGVGAIGLMVIVGVDVLKEEFTPLYANPSTEGPRSQDIETNIADPNIAFIKVAAVGYSDDADPQDDGIAIDIQFYGYESEPVSFSNVQMDVEIELIAFDDPFEMLESGSGDVVYQGSISVDHSMRLGEMFGNYIRIPYRDIQIDQIKYQRFGAVKVMVELPVQGSFEEAYEPVPLYADE